MPGDELGKLVVADARPLRSRVLVPQAVDRRHGEREDLRIVRERIDDAQALVEIVQRPDAAHALAHVLLRRRRLQQTGEELWGKEMIEGVDVAHA